MSDRTLDEAFQFLDSTGDLGDPTAVAPKPGPESSPAPMVQGLDQAAAKLEDEQKKTLQGALYVGSQADPERHAKVLELANQLKMPPAIVDRNFERLSLQQKRESADLDSVVKKTPGLAAWLENPDNMAVAHDDLPALSKVEDQFQERSRLWTIARELNFGIDQILASAAKLPALAVDVGYSIKHLNDSLSGLTTGETPVPQRSPEWLRNNPVSQFFEQRAEKFKTPELEIDIASAALRERDYRKAAIGILHSAVASMPTTLAAIAGGPLGLLVLGATSAAQKNAENQANPELNPAVGTANALTTGALEALGEKFGSAGIFEKWSKALMKSFGKQTTRQVFLDIGRVMVASIFGEGMEEASTSVAQDLADYFMGVNPHALEGIDERAAVAFAVGSASGGITTGPTTILSSAARTRFKMVREAKEMASFYKNLGEATRETKLNERSSSLRTQYIAALAEGSPVQDVHVSPEAFDAYFQSVGENPVAIVQAADLTQAYEHAKETGSDMKVPLSVWIEQFVNTNHYLGLQNDIKFNPDQHSVNEAIQEQEKLKAEVEAAAAEAQAEGKPKPLSPEAQFEADIKAIEKDVMDRIMATGLYQKDEAKRLALLQAEHIRAMAMSTDTGESPLSLHQRFTPEMRAFDSMPAEFNNQPEEHVLEQANRIEGTNVLVAEFGKKKTEASQPNEPVQLNDAEQTMLDDLSKKELKQIRQSDNPLQTLGELMDESRLEGLSIDPNAEYALESVLSALGVQAASGAPAEVTQLPGTENAERVVQASEKLERIKARYEGRGSKTIHKAIDKAQNPKLGPYVNDPKIPGTGWAPNYAAEPTGVIGPDHISQPNRYMAPEGTETDPLKWADMKYGATKELIAKHAAQGIPLTINTSSDLVAHDDYIAAMGPDTLVRIHLTTRNPYTDRLLFPGNPSRARLETAAKKLQEAGIRVELVKPTIEGIIQAAGGLENVAKQLAIDPSEVQAYIARDLGPSLVSTDTFFQTATPNSPAFYSKLERTVEEKMGGSATAQQVNALLKDIKEEERKWSGIDEFLKGKEKVKKEELLAFLRGNQIEIHEVTKGGASPESIRKKIRELDQTPSEQRGDDYHSRRGELFVQLGEATDSQGQTKYNTPKLVLPGGENYREILFTLPQKSGASNDDFSDWASKKYGDRWLDFSDSKLKELGKQYQHEKLIDAESASYRSSHWDERNVLAHVRLNDRVDSEGKRVLFVEEIQSDWHQEGRKKGYKSDDFRLPDGFSIQQNENIKRPGLRWTVTNAEGLLYGSGETEAAALQNYLKASQSDAVPDAPFKKTWHEFALKKIIRMAVEQGYDRIAWTTGEQQAERYDLSEKVGEINYKITEDGKVRAEAFGPELTTLVDAKTYTRDEAESTFGKELVAKMFAGEGSESSLIDGKKLSKGFKSLSGDNLKLGGEGMKGFYDKIVPDFLKKFTKKWGAKVGTTEIEVLSENRDSQVDPFDQIKVHSLDITNAMKESVLNEGMTLFQRDLGPGIPQTTHPKPEAVEVVQAKRELTDSKPIHKEVRDRMIEKYRGGLYRNDHTGWEIGIPAKGIKKTLGSSVQDVDILALEQMDELLRAAVYDRTGPDLEGDRNIKAVHYFYAPLQVGDQIHAVRILVRETNEGDKFYHHAVSEKVQPAGISGAPSFEGGKPANGGPHTLSIQEFEGLLNAERNSHPLFHRGADPLGFFSPGKNLIGLLPEMNASSLIHELAHSWLRNIGILYQELSQIPEAQRTEKQKAFLDWGNAMLEYLGVKAFDEIKTPEHEKFAETSEKYISTGEAPSSRLREAFNAFKVWLLNVYRGLVHSHIEISPEVRKLFDRLLVADEEIEATQAEMSMLPLFADPKFMGMSEEKTKQYLKAQEAATEYAKQVLERKVMADYERERKKWYKEKRARVWAEIEAVVNQQIVFKAIAALQGHKLPDGAPLPPEVPELKLDKDELKRQFGPDIISKLPKGVSTKGGMLPDLVAQALGFENGDQLVTAMANTPKREDVIEQQVEARMAEQYPDIIRDGRTEQEALAAVHNENRARAYQLELEHLATGNFPMLKGVMRRIARPVPNLAVVREQAAQIVGTLPMEELNPQIYLRAEVKAGKQAADLLAKGEINAAFEAKRKQLLNHELYRAVQKAQERVERAENLFDRLEGKDEDIAKSRDIGLVNAARAVVGLFGIRGEPGVNPLEHLKQLQAYDPDTYGTISHLVAGAIENRPKQGGKLTYGTFLNMADTVQALWDLARSQRQTEIDGKKMELEQVQAALEARIAKLTGGKPYEPGKHAAITESEKRTLKFLGIKAGLTRMESWIDFMDGDDPSKPFRTYLWQPVVEAIDRYRVKKTEVVKKFKALVEEAAKKGIFTQQRISAPELGYEFNDKAHLLGAILHTGNGSNLEKLLVGNGWGIRDQDGDLDTSRWDRFIQRMYREGVIGKADMDFVQSLWDLMESLKPEAQKAHKQMYGHYFSEVTADPVVTPFGTYRGGYAPAVADPFRDDAAARRADREALEDQANSFMFPTGGRGFTKSRVPQYTAPLSMDLNLVMGNIDKVLRFIHIEPRVRDAGKLLVNKQFRASLNSVSPVITSDLLMTWLQRAAKQRRMTTAQTEGGRALEAWARYLRTATGLQLMSWNFINSLQNFTGFTIAAIKVEPKYLRNGFWQYIRAPGTVAALVSEKSEMMRTRMEEQASELLKDANEVMVNPSKFDKARDFMIHHGRIFQSVTQGVLDVAVWQGAYEQAIEKGADEKGAVREADSAVKLTQGSFNIEDIALAESGSPILALFMQFAGYFNMVANLLGTEFGKVRRDMGLRRGAPRLLYVYTMGFMAPAFLSVLIAQAMSGSNWDDDDDGQYMDDLVKTFFMSQVQFGTAMIPVAGQAINSSVNRFNNKQYDDRMSLSPAITLVEGSLGVPFDLYKAAQGNGNAKRTTRDVLTAMGLMSGLPLAPVAKPAGYLMDVYDGAATPSNPAELARGLVTGRTPQE